MKQKRETVINDTIEEVSHGLEMLEAMIDVLGTYCTNHECVNSFDDTVSLTQMDLAWGMVGDYARILTSRLDDLGYIRLTKT